MIHEFIDYKKKAKSNGNKIGKTFRDSNETWSADQSGSEWPSTMFIPPWLRNNLGLNLKSNQNLDWSTCLPNFTGIVHGSFDQKTEKVCPEITIQNLDEQNERDEIKCTVDDDISKKCCFFDTPQRECEEERLIQLSDVESFRTLPVAEKENLEENDSVRQTSNIWHMKPKASDPESSSTDSEISTPSARRKNIRVTEVRAKTPVDSKQGKNDDKKRGKNSKKRHKIKQRIVLGHAPILGEIDVDYLLEKKAKEVLECYAKKKVHSAASDIKRFEAKLILLHIKFSLGRLTPDDTRLLEEIKAQAGSKENFDRLIRHVREVNLREILETQNYVLKAERNKDRSEKMQQRKEERILASTDDEDDIKRFSELLKRNQNQEEKRKCLEEVRSYFEKKRRTRLTKCRVVKGHSNENNLEGKEECKSVKSNTKKVPSNKPSADWKAKFKISNKEAVGKAVNETLQKFAEFYNFHVTPSLMSSMKNNVLKGIQSHSFENGENLKARRGLHHNEEGNIPSAEPQNNVKDEDCSPRESSSKDLKTKSMKESLSNSHLIETDTVEFEQINRIKTELENLINAIKGNTTKFKVQSVILELENQNSCGKNNEFIYSFKKKCLEPKKSNSIHCGNDMEVQVGRGSNTINADTQTQRLLTGFEKYIQTRKNSQKSIDIQTDGTLAIELKKLKDSDVSPGLYRMVKSKHPGRFYLYPENEEQARSLSEANDKHKNNEIFEEEKAPTKKPQFDKRERDINDISELVIVDGLRKDKNSSHTPDKKQEFVCLWDGKKVNNGADLKAHVESFLKEKLKEIRWEQQDNEKDTLNRKVTYSCANPRRTNCDNDLEFTILNSEVALENENEDLGLGHTFKVFEEKDASRENFEEGVIPNIFVKDASTQSSENTFEMLNGKKEKSSGKSQHSSKTTILKKKRKIILKRDRKSRQNIADLEKAMELMSECLSNKRMKFERESSMKDSTCDSGTTLESNTSSYAKDTSDDHRNIVFGFSDCKYKKNRRTTDVQVQTNHGNNSCVTDVANQELNWGMENHKHWEAIEGLLHRVNRKERKNLWNDVRELIKSKIGKDIDNENANEVCIQIEQDVKGTTEGDAKKLVLAKGYYARNEGDVEVEIDLTLNDLERIIRRRERNLRRRNLFYRKNSKVLRSSSSGQSKQEQVQKILKTLSRSRPNQSSKDVTIVKLNKNN